MDINDLLGLYKAGNNNIIEDIISFQKPFLLGTIKKHINTYGLSNTKDIYEDAMSEAVLLFIKAIDLCVGNRANQIVTYLNKHVGWGLKHYLIKNYRDKKHVFSDYLQLF